jgi:hypothetical protein
VNLLTKAATAPFALIGAMFGGGEDLDYIEFDYGRASLNDAGMKKSKEPIDVDNVEIDPKEYEKYLRLAYKAEKFTKPRNMIGLEKTIPVPEMEKLMLTNAIVTEDDLHALARRRASKVMEQILKSGQVDAGRMFIVDSRSITPPKNEKLKESRVEFKLK